jgi:hypothetical protein
MAEYGAWNRKGATLSDVTALKEYGVDAEFITRGIRSGDSETGKARPGGTRTYVSCETNWKRT